MCSLRAEATILHADLDSFYASVEQRDDPSPQRAAQSSWGAASCSPRATRPRRSASARRWAAAQARRLCPNLIVVSPRLSAYSEASKAVFEIFDDTTPLVEGISPDEAFLDVGGLRRLSGTPFEIATRLRARVLEEVGLPITVGIARTKFLAKVASGVAKPDGLLVVPPDRELEFLHPLPVERLWGVGHQDRGEAARPRHRHRRRCRAARQSTLDRPSSVAAPAAICMRSRTTTTRDRSRSAGDGGRSVRSARSGGVQRHRARSKQLSPGSSTG